MSKVAGRVLVELVRPLRELDITDTEFACLKAIIFFAPGLSKVPQFFKTQLVQFSFLFKHSGFMVSSEKLLLSAKSLGKVRESWSG